MQNSLKLCCISDCCNKVLTHEDNLSLHTGHTVVTSKNIIDSYDKVDRQFQRELKSGYIDTIKTNLNSFMGQQHDFIDNVINELNQFQEYVIDLVNGLKKQLFTSKNQISVDESYLLYVKRLQNSLDGKNTENNQRSDSILETLIMLGQKQSQNISEKDLKDGVHDKIMKTASSNLQIVVDYEFSIQLPSQYLFNLIQDQKEQKATTCFISNKVKSLATDFNSRLDLWEKQIGNIVTKLKSDSSSNQSANFMIERQIPFEGHQAQKILFIDNEYPLSFIVFSRIIGLWDQQTKQIKLTIPFQKPILDADVEPKKNLLAVCTDNKILLYQINKGIKLFRSYKITIDMSKSVRIKFFENQICVSCGTHLEFFSLHPKEHSQPFIQTVSFHSYWDRISIVDYVVLNKSNSQEMLLMIGSVGGILALYNSGFKELYSKQHHQGVVTQIRFLQSEQYDKVIVSAGDDMRINIYCVEAQQALKCIRTIKFQWPISDILVHQRKLFVTLKDKNMLTFMEVNEKYESNILPTQIVNQEGDQIMEFNPTDILALHKNKIIIAQDDCLLVGNFLIS